MFIFYSRNIFSDFGISARSPETKIDQKSMRRVSDDVDNPHNYSAANRRTLHGNLGIECVIDWV